MRIPLATKSGKGRSVQLSPEMLVNLYAEQAPEGAKSNVVVHGTPGFTLFSDISSAKPRGLHKSLSTGVVYAVIGSSLYRIASDGTETSLGTVLGTGRVIFADSTNEIVLVAGNRSYTYSESDGLLTISSEDFPGASSVTYIDGYFVFTNRQAGSKDQFFISSILDGQTYDALDYATAEKYPDLLQRVFADHSELLLFGTDSIEVWFNTGAADFPFAPAQGSVIDQGLGAVHSIEKVDESVIWLDNEGIVRRLNGTTPMRISTHAIEYQISLGDWENAYSWSYTMEGHQFYVLTIPAATITQTAGTYVYDAATQLWHQRKSYELDYCRVGFYVKAYGKHLVMDSITGLIYELSLDVYQENGEHLIAEMQFPQIQADGERFLVHKFQVDMEVGSLPIGGNETVDAGYNYIVTSAGGITGQTVMHGLSPSTLAYGSGTLPSATITHMVCRSDSGTLIFTKWQNASALPSCYYSLDGGATVALATSDMTGGVAITTDYVSKATWSPTHNQFLALIDGDGVVRSSNGITWTYTALSGGDSFAGYDVDYVEWIEDEGIYVGGITTNGGLGNGNNIVISSNGTTWTLKNNGSTNNNMSWSNAVYISSIGRILLFGRSGITYSDNGGANWSYLAVTGLSSVGSSPTVAYSESLDLLVAVHINQDLIFKSGDHGATWTSQSTSPATGMVYITELNGMFYIFGGNNQFLTSEDGVEWEFGRIPPGVSDLKVVRSAVTYFEVIDSVDVPLTENPQIVLRSSKNGGKTYSLTASPRSIGRQGEYLIRVIWNRLGQYRSFTPKITISDPVKRALFSAYIEVEPCVG